MIGSSGLPVYYTYSRFPIARYPHNPASLFAQWTDLALRYYAYSGNNSWVLKAEAFLAHHLYNGTTPNTSGWAWPGVPYASSDPGDVLYRGASITGSSGSGDGLGVIEVDKVGGLGLGWLAIWKHHGSGATGKRQDFLEAAVHCARVLAKHATAGNLTTSPWPFRAFAQSGASRTAGGHIGERYSAHIIWNIQLLDAVLAIPGALSAEDATTVKGARSLAWEWMRHFPLSNNHWCGYCEDLTTVGLDWQNKSNNGYIPGETCDLQSIEDGECECDIDSMTFRMTARYLMGVPVAGGVVVPNGGAGSDTPVAWQDAVPKMLAWVEGALIFWSRPGENSPAVQYGARCVSEQRDDPNRMSCHTSSYASVLAQYSELLSKHQLNASAAADAAENARLSWAWASYAMSGPELPSDEGNIHVTPGQGETDAWWTVTVDTLMNTMVLMGAMPEVGTPPHETHIVRATAVLRSVKYGGTDGTGRSVVVSYEAADAVASEKIRVQADALSGIDSTIAVLLDGEPLKQVGSALEVAQVVSQMAQAGAWSLDVDTGVVEVGRTVGGRVAIVRQKTRKETKRV